VQDNDIKSFSYDLRKWPRFLDRDHFEAFSVLQVDRIQDRF
jgi:hypothetical protein